MAVAVSGFACVDLLMFGFVLLFIVFCKLDCVAELIMFCGFIDLRFAAVRLGFMLLLCVVDVIALPLVGFVCLIVDLFASFGVV